MFTPIANWNISIEEPSGPQLPVMTGLNTWLIADTDVTVDTGGVSLWLDQSGNENHLSQTNSALRPDHNTDRITFALNDILNSTNTISVGCCLVVLSQNNAAFGSLLGFTTKHGFVRNLSNTQYYGTTLTNSTSHAFRGPARANGVTMSYASGAIPGQTNYSPFAINTKILLSHQIGQFSLTTPYSADLRLGKGDDIGSAAAVGDIYEIIVYDGQLSESDRKTMEDYLKTKYSL